MAVTAGKKIKTEVTFSRGNLSVIHQALACLKEEGYTVQGKTCMVIGNGEMGKIAAQTLRENGADVTVTIRQYRSGIVNIPQGCRRINTEREWTICRNVTWWSARQRVPITHFGASFSRKFIWSIR